MLPSPRGSCRVRRRAAGASQSRGCAQRSCSAPMSSCCSFFLSEGAACPMLMTIAERCFIEQPRWSLAHATSCSGGSDSAARYESTCAMACCAPT